MSHRDLVSAIQEGCAMIDEMQTEVDRRIALVHAVTRDNAEILKYLTTHSSFNEDVVKDKCIWEGAENSTSDPIDQAEFVSLKNKKNESSDETTKSIKGCAKIPSYAVRSHLCNIVFYLLFFFLFFSFSCKFILLLIVLSVIFF